FVVEGVLERGVALVLLGLEVVAGLVDDVGVRAARDAVQLVGIGRDLDLIAARVVAGVGVVARHVWLLVIEGRGRSVSAWWGWGCRPSRRWTTRSRPRRCRSGR